MSKPNNNYLRVVSILHAACFRTGRHFEVLRAVSGFTANDLSAMQLYDMNVASGNRISCAYVNIIVLL